MRLIRVKVTGYGRLRNSSFSATRKLTAILGPNEAGKTTLLRAMLALNDESPVAERNRNRSGVTAEADTLVEASYALSDADLAEFRDRSWINLPTRFSVKKTAGGALIPVLDKQPEHRKETWYAARGAVQAFRDGVGQELDPSDDLPAEVNSERLQIQDILQRLSDGLNEKVVSISQDEVELLRASIASQSRYVVWLEMDNLLPVLEAIAPLVAEPHPNRNVERHLESRRPRFELFSEDDRNLRHEYSFAELDAGEPRALRNLLSLAGVTWAEIRPDASRRTPVATAQDRAIETLQHTFAQAWKQHPISVKVSFEPDQLIILVRDNTPGGQTIAFDERSDGLRMFVALTAFLSTRGGVVPPILLIDEAEARLHWDAQADLIAVLQSSDEVGQILYTTHSPAALPSDLGTGVIFVQPDRNDNNLSTIRRDFWSVQSEDSFGATPILFMMGASAAAFSRVRRAVVAEGPSDMLLLPTVFRSATKLAELDFQVVPGISITSKEEFSRLDETGARVAYLVDGDDQGIEWKKQLIEENIDPARIKSLPTGLAVEDLMDRDFYVQVFLDLAGRSESPAELSLSPGVLKPQLEALCRDTWGIEPPGAVDVAEAILSKLDTNSPGAPDHQRLKLAPGAGPAVRELYGGLTELLKPMGA